MTQPSRTFDELLEIAKAGQLLSLAELERVRRELKSPASSADAYTLLHILGKANDHSSLPIVRDYLNFGVGDPEDDGMVRRIAVQILAHWWHDKEAFHVVREMAFEDTSPLVRAVAASALGKIASVYPEFKGEAARCLLRGIGRHADEQKDVWGSFYTGMLELAEVHPAAWPIRPGQLSPDELDSEVVERVKELASSE
jgi:hypothetical protein